MQLAAGETQPSLSRMAFTSANTWKRKTVECTSACHDSKKTGLLLGLCSQVHSQFEVPEVQCISISWYHSLFIKIYSSISLLRSKTATNSWHTADASRTKNASFTSLESQFSVFVQQSCFHISSNVRYYLIIDE